eukprot:scaffold105672_cov34-Tisochrysis_lutea.AAC.5
MSGCTKSLVFAVGRGHHEGLPDWQGLRCQKFAVRPRDPPWCRHDGARRRSTPVLKQLRCYGREGECGTTASEDIDVTHGDGTLGALCSDAPQAIRKRTSLSVNKTLCTNSTCDSNVAVGRRKGAARSTPPKMMLPSKIS